MDENLVREVKKKREFSELPENLIKRALEKEKNEVKKARALLRKYFGVFLTNKVLKLDNEEILKKHISSKERNYQELYLKILSGKEKTIIDLGAGVNGFSFPFIKKINKKTKYLGIEATGQLVRKMNEFFKKNKLNASAICLDLFELEKILEIIKKEKAPKTIFLFNVIDALESFEWDYSKKVLLGIKKEMGDEDRIVISFPIKSLSGKTRFKAKRNWILDFLRENFSPIDDFEMNGERFIVGKV